MKGFKRIYVFESNQTLLSSSELILSGVKFSKSGSTYVPYVPTATVVRKLESLLL